MSSVGMMLGILGYTVCLLIPWYIFILIYGFVFHPLRKYPGPFLAKFTDGHAGYYAIKRRPHINTYRNLQKYGPVYREGPKRLVFSSLTALQDIYFNSRVTKGRAYCQGQTNQANLFSTPDNDVHQRKRKVIEQVFSDRSLLSFSPVISNQINIFLRQLLRSSQLSDVVNMTPLCRNLAFDIACHLSFGYTLKTQTDATNRFIHDSMGQALYVANLAYTWPLLGKVGSVLRWFGKKEANRFQQVVKQMIVSRMAEPKNAKSDFYSVVAGEDVAKEDRLHESELWGEAFFFLSAGGTTVATAVSGMFFHLAHHPDVYSRLATEIRNTFESGEDISNGPKLASCKYLRAVIDESLRMAPPSLAPLWREREATSTEPLIVDGHVIPRGTQVAIHLYSVLHDADYFPDPFTFRPERWLGPKDGKEPESFESRTRRATMRRAQVSFGLGDHGCAGKSMAYLEISMTIARTLWYFDFEMAPGEAGKLGAGSGASNEPWDAPGQFQLYDILVADHDGPNMVFKPRGTYWQELMKQEV
ncbi:cytochrome P450 [Hypoxylon sp. FL0890]|nr:cytochrome P450 [Hypoxylon sp. FL0890]